VVVVGATTELDLDKNDKAQTYHRRGTLMTHEGQTHDTVFWFMLNLEIMTNTFSGLKLFVLHNLDIRKRQELPWFCDLKVTEIIMWNLPSLQYILLHILLKLHLKHWKTKSVKSSLASMHFISLPVSLVSMVFTRKKIRINYTQMIFI
jgi:hypothetical protein